MTTIQLNSEIDIESVMQGMGKLNNSELEKVLSRISIMLEQKKSIEPTQTGSKATS